MSTAFVNILRIFIVILILFITPQTAIVYSRDQLLTLQNHAVLLNHGQCSVISQLRLRRRGCRAGAHLRRRLLAADRATFSADSTTTHEEIPVVIGQRAETVNRNQLFRGRRDSRVSALLHLSDVSSTTIPSFSSLSTLGPQPAACLDERSELPSLPMSPSPQGSTFKRSFQPPISPLNHTTALSTFSETVSNNASGVFNASLSINGDTQRFTVKKQNARQRRRLYRYWSR